MLQQITSSQQDFYYQSQRGRCRGFRGHWRGNFGRGNSGTSGGNYQNNNRAGFKGCRSRGRGHCQPGWRFQPEWQLFKLASSSVAGQTEEVQSSNLNSSPNCESTECTSGFKKKMVGPANVGRILICGVETTGLIDSSSMISTISESFYRSMDPVPELGDTKDFGIDLMVAS